MIEPASWATAGFTLLGQHVLWCDLAGNACALATVALAIRQTVWTWPVQLLGAVLLCAASLGANLMGNALKQVLFAALAIYGWHKWARGIREGSLRVRPATTDERLHLTGVLLSGTAALTLLFDALNASGPPPISSAPLPDALIFVASALATYAHGRALIDFWLLWLLVDIVGIPLAFASGLAVSGLTYAILAILVVAGASSWIHEFRTRDSTTQLAPAKG